MGASEKDSKTIEIPITPMVIIFFPIRSQLMSGIAIIARFFSHTDVYAATRRFPTICLTLLSTCRLKNDRTFDYTSVGEWLMSSECPVTSGIQWDTPVNKSIELIIIFIVICAFIAFL